MNSVMQQSLRNLLLVVCLFATMAAAQTGADGRNSHVRPPAASHNTWDNGVPLPTAVKEQAVGVIRTRIYNVGGKTATAVIPDNQIYNVVTSSWSTGAPMPTAVANAASAVVTNILYVFGGTTDGIFSGITNQVWAYSAKKNAWTAKSAMPTAREGAVAVAEGNIIYVIGGVDANQNPLATVESYNPATDTWATEAPMAVAKSRAAAGLRLTTILAIDGLTASGVTGDNEGYDASRNSWSPLVSDPTPRTATCNGVVGPALYSAGGVDDSGSALTTNNGFFLGNNKWKSLAPMPQAVAAAGSAVYKGQLYCFGGGSTDESGFVGTVYNNMQVYQP